jgi:hypothetical protein
LNFSGKRYGAFGHALGERPHLDQRQNRVDGGPNSPELTAKDQARQEARRHCSLAAPFWLCLSVGGGMPMPDRRMGYPKV